MEILMPDGSAKVVNNSQELSQPSFGVDPLEDWPCHMNAAPKPAFQLFLTTPNHGKIEALERAGIHIMHKQDIDTHRHYILVDKDNLEKLEAYLKSNTSRESELQVEAQGWFENFPQALEPGTELYEWRSLYEKDSFELDTKTTITTSRELGHNETTEMSRDVTRQLPLVTSAIKNTLYLGSGMEVLDASCGAAVTCLGYDNLENIWAAIQDVKDVFYVAHRSYSTSIAEDFETNLLSTTEGHMVKAYTYNSGTDAVEAALKLGRQYFWIRDETNRINYIACKPSYHGSTLAALSLGYYEKRRKPYEDILPGNMHHVSACDPYWDRKPHQTDEEYVRVKKEELVNMFEHLGGDTVIAFMVEPVAGAALACAPKVPGYLEAMKEVCDEYESLLIYDEIMCGSGRTGKMHAWQHYGVVPDIQVIGKGLGAGVQPIAAMLCNQRVVDAISSGLGYFAHGHTYENHAIVCAVGNEVLNIIRGLLANIEAQGRLLGSLLREGLEEHPNVGDIRGMGLFWGIVLLQDKVTKTPFESSFQIHERLHKQAIMTHEIYLYPGSGSLGDRHGDHVIIAPQYNCTEADVEVLAARTLGAIKMFFEEAAIDKPNACQEVQE